MVELVVVIVVTGMVVVIVVVLEIVVVLVTVDTVKVADAEFLLVESVAVKVCAPPVVDGTVNEQSKVPVELVMQSLGLVCTFAPPNVKVIPWPLRLAAKPVPVTDTVSPMGPFVGLSVMKGVMVKDAVPLFVPSLTVTVSDPAGSTGTLNVHPDNRVPLASVEHGVGDATTPLKRTLTPEVMLGAKPVPDTETDAPVGPEGWPRVTDGVMV